MPFPLRASVHGIALLSLVAVMQPSAPSRAAEVVVRAPDGLSESLRDASLSQTAVTEGRTEAQDLIAAAQADYRRVLGALYERGFFSAEVHIPVSYTHLTLPTSDLV